MNFQLLAAALVLSCIATASAAADCSREDIDHYLDRGFTPQQVLKLCRPDAAADGDSGGEREATAYWRDVIRARDVRLSDDALSYVREQCIPYDRPNFAQQRKKACGKVHYRIALAGLSVRDTHKKLLYWGRNSIAIRSSQIQRRYELNQADLPERDQRILERELERGQMTEIPIRDGVAVGVARRRLEELAR